jgi:hypothetical protein
MIRSLRGRTPDGCPLAERLVARIEEATAEYEAGTNLVGLIFPSPRASTSGPATSTAMSSSAPTPRSAGATRTAAAGGGGTACGTCSAPPPCSPGSSTPPTCPPRPGTPTSAPPCGRDFRGGCNPDLTSPGAGQRAKHDPRYPPDRAPSPRPVTAHLKARPAIASRGRMRSIAGPCVLRALHPD